MSTKEVVALFLHLLDTQHKRPTGPPEVVPLLLTEYDSDLPLVMELCRHSEVPIIVANTGEDASILGVPIAGESDVPAALRQLIEAITVRGRSLEIEITGNSRAAVRIANEPLPENPGDRNLLGSLTALLHRGLAGQSLGIIAYDHAQMDRQARSAVWNLLNRDLPTSGAPMPTNLVACVGGALDSTYLGPGPSLRFAVRQGTLVRRHAWPVSEREIARLAGGDEPLVLFLGAGASFASGLPLGDSMRNEALREFMKDQSGAPVPELLRGFFEWVRDNDRLLPTEQEEANESDFIETLTLERVLREVYYEMHGTGLPKVLADFAEQEERALSSPSDGVLALREFISRRRGLVIVTVNFDRLVEDKMGDAVVTYSSEEDFAQAAEALESYFKAREGPVPVLKLHGSIDRPESIVANVELTALGLSPARSDALMKLVGQPDHPTAWVYVGYSMRDVDLLAELTVPRVALGIDERWVAPLTDGNVERLVRLHRLPLWEEHRKVRTLHARSISEFAETFFIGLRDRLPKDLCGVG